jgi:cytidylate kinase
VDGYFPEREIRTNEVSAAVAHVAAVPKVREWMKKTQQDCIQFGNLVMEGRDIGTKVFPETPYKFFLTADLAVRAQRREAELAARGTPQSYDEVLAEMEKRDRDDATRAESPLTRDDSYVLVDSGGRGAAEIVEEIERRIRVGGLTPRSRPT